MTKRKGNQENRSHNETITLDRYYKNCISVRNPSRDVEDYVRKTGFSYRLGHGNVLHISNITAFLEKCESDRMRVVFVGEVGAQKK